MNSNQKTMLTGSLICLLGAMLIYAFDWTEFITGMSVWDVAKACQELDSGTAALLLYTGAIAALALLGWNAYKVLRPLLNNMDWLWDAQRASAGMIVSILFSIGFIIAMREEELDVTAWPVVEIALCVAAKLLLWRMDSNEQGTSSQTLASNNALNAPGKTEKRENLAVADVVIPISNYDPDCPLQPAQIIYSPGDCKASVLIACYVDSQAIEALQIGFQLKNVFGDFIDTEKYVYQAFETASKGKRCFLKTEAIDIPELASHAKEIRLARAVICKVKTTDESIQPPVSYKDSPLNDKELAEIKGLTMNRDAVVKKNVLDLKWTCVCGHENDIAENNCQRCGRPKNNVVEELLEDIENAVDFGDLIKVLDIRIDSGWEELKEIKVLCGSYRAYGYDAAKRAAVSRIKAVIPNDVEVYTE